MNRRSASASRSAWCLSLAAVVVSILGGTSTAAADVKLVGQGAPVSDVGLARDAQGGLDGSTNVALRNDADSPVRLTLRFFADATPGSSPVGATTRPLALTGGHTTLHAHATTVLDVTAVLDDRE